MRLKRSSIRKPVKYDNVSGPNLSDPAVSYNNTHSWKRANQIVENQKRAMPKKNNILENERITQYTSEMSDWTVCCILLTWPSRPLSIAYSVSVFGFSRCCSPANDLRRCFKKYTSHIGHLKAWQTRHTCRSQGVSHTCMTVIIIMVI